MEIRHLTRRQWRVAVFVILFILASGFLLREIHFGAVTAKEKLNADRIIAPR